MNFVILDFPVESKSSGVNSFNKSGKNRLVVGFLGVGNRDRHIFMV